MFKGLIAGGLRVTVLPFLFAPVNLKTGLVFIFGCIIPQLLFFFYILLMSFLLFGMREVSVLYSGTVGGSVC